MEIAASSLANREMALNKATVEQDILQKTLEKTEQSQLNSAVKPVEQANNDKSNNLDFYI